MASVPYLKVYKDSNLVDTISLQGQDRWIAGRHAHCDIVVGHASNSRRHLEIQVLHVTKELRLIDLQSAHGTMVNGEALAPAKPHIMQQGDTLQMGASTRSYKVDWVPVIAIEQVSEASVPVLERSSPNGSKASSRCKLGNTQESRGNRQQLMKDQCTKQKAENVPSSFRTQSQRAGRTELPPRTPVRRSPFAKVPASTLNKRSPQGPALRKSNTLPDKIIASSKIDVVTEYNSLAPTTKETQESGPEGSASPNLWLRRCSSAPMPTVVTPEDALGAHNDNEVEVLPALNREPSREDLPNSLTNLSSYDEYPSDKENYQPAKDRRKSLSWDGRQSCSSPNILAIDRQPFAELKTDLKLAKPMFSSPLASSPDSDFGSRTLGLPPPQRQVTSAMVNNLDSLFGNLKLGGEKRCQWHIVVDTNCLLDTDALKSLKQLEGIRETRIVIPKIVLRELDGLKKRHDLGLSARVALRWIEDCMEKKPFWMHVQRSTEVLPVRRTQDRGFMALTNDDQILECALLFESEVMDGRVVLLTRDTALKIKAMAEGMTVDDATAFCENLLSPYSERFLWLGSTAYRPPVTGPTTSRSTQRYTGYAESYAPPSGSPFSMANLEMRTKIQSPPKVKGHGKHGVAEFRCHYSERPQGLKALLA
ncbi:hypothetical protein M758_4G006100 [Ceratodon purpureus]|nr:hypothetical protein M758_4G006100 [Ceratodon purpureus]